MTSAETCRELIRKESRPEEVRLGGGFMQNPFSGQLYYSPGHLTYNDYSNDWAYLVEYSIYYGVVAPPKERERREKFLRGFQKSIQQDCPSLKAQQSEPFKLLREMMKELVEDGSFCPGNKVLRRPLLAQWKNYKKVLTDAVKAGRFSEECAGVSTVTSSYRESKEMSGPAKDSTSSSTQASGQ